MISPNEVHRMFREGTKVLHSQLDAQAVLSVFKGQSKEFSDYIAALKQLYRPHSYLEMLVKAGAGSIDYVYHPRAQLLGQDICLIEEGFIECHSPLSKSASTSCEDLWGYLYVLEGSKQGSKYISAIIERQFSGAAPTNFIDQVGVPIFKPEDFWSSVASHLTTLEQIDKSISAAVNAFKFYIALLEDENLTEESAAKSYIF